MEVEIRQRAQLSQIGAKGVGEEMQVVAGDTIVVEEEVGLGAKEGILVVAEDRVATRDSITWFATNMECMAI